MTAKFWNTQSRWTIADFTGQRKLKSTCQPKKKEKKNAGIGEET